MDARSSMVQLPELPQIPEDLGEQILLSLERPAREREEALAALCAAHPEHAAAIGIWTSAVDAVGLNLRGPELVSEFAPQQASQCPSGQLGPYRLLEMLGRGGMGTVHLAEQEAPVRRRVALKVIHAGREGPRLLQRFATERSALARMQHANIARFLDAGADAQGRPWFAMEFVSGAAITTWCDERRLTLRARIDLFLQVCAGVEHAHRRGILHRDLKPTNVLVTETDGTACPKVIDFGLAKAAVRDVGEPVLTQHGQALGTPEYMSPEQMGRHVADVDARADVYSLGVVLHELITGKLPFSPAKLLRSAPERQAKKPSTVISQPGKRTELFARLRATTPAALFRQLRGDVDRIVLRALESDRERRYPSVSAFAEDLRRHLRHEPVLAGPPHLAYRTRKFLRRRPTLSLTAVAALVLIAASLLFMARETKRAAHGTRAQLANKALADENTEKARREKDRARVKAAQAQEDRNRANDAARIAREAEREADGHRLAADESGKKLANTLADFDLLADKVKLEWALDRAAELEVAVPENIASYERWLEVHGRPLVGRLHTIEQVLARLRARAAPLSASAPAPPIRFDPALLATLPFDLGSATRGNDLRGSIEDLQTLDVLPLAALLPCRPWIRELGTWEFLRAQRLGNERRTWRFASEGDQFLHDWLSELVLDLEDFELEIVPLVESRVAWAREVEDRTVRQYRSLWDKAIAAIRKSDGVDASRAYAGLELAPQIGLVPLGMDQRSKLWEFVHLASGTPGKELPTPDPQTGWLRVTEDSAIVLVLIPGGTFTMGAQDKDPKQPNYDPWARSSEGPVHEVPLDPFFLAKHELTQGQFARITGDLRPSLFRAGMKLRDGSMVTLAFPVESVSFERAALFLRGHGLVVPSEAWWEYGCRAGTTSVWPTGNESKSLADHANVADLHLRRHWAGVSEDSFSDGHLGPAPAGSFAPNAFGLHDMIGNAGEHIAEPVYRYEYGVRAEDGRRVGGRPLGGASSWRGGSFWHAGEWTRCAFRMAQDKGSRGCIIGLRVARRIDP